MSNPWKPASEAPADAWPLAIAATLQCDCDGAKGGRVVMTGARQGGKWVLECQHDIDITHFMELPKPPAH